MSVFKCFSKNNQNNVLKVQGSYANGGSNLIAGMCFQNYDLDTNQTYDMATIGIKDGSSNNQFDGLGDFVIETKAGPSNVMTEAMRITHKRHIGIGTTDPLEKLTINDGNVLVSSKSNTVGYIAQNSNYQIGLLSYNASNIQSSVQSNIQGLFYNNNFTIGKYTGNITNPTLINSNIVIDNSNNIYLNGSTTINSNLITIGNANVGTLTSIGTASLSNTLNVIGKTTLSNTLQVVGLSALSNDLDVAQNTYLRGQLNVTQKTTLSNTLNVTGNTTLSSNLLVSGTSIFDSNVSINGSIFNSARPYCYLRDTTTTIDTLNVFTVGNVVLNNAGMYQPAFPQRIYFPVNGIYNITFFNQAGTVGFLSTLVARARISFTNGINPSSISPIEVNTISSAAAPLNLYGSWTGYQTSNAYCTISYTGSGNTRWNTDGDISYVQGVLLHYL